jgi:outer membrane lipoprotein SlyB
MFSRSIRIATLGAAVLLAACTTTSPDVVSKDEAQRMSKVQDAVVLSARPVVVDGTQSGAGGATGAIVGGVAGSSVGGGREAVAVGVLGAVAGAVVGNAVERFSTRESAYEILVQLPTGERRSIIQAQGKETFAPGEAVILVTTAGKTRVMKAPPGVAPQAAPAKS